MSQHYPYRLNHGDQRDILELFVPVIGCFLLLFLRHFSEKFVFAPSGIWFGLNMEEKELASNFLLKETIHKRVEDNPDDEIFEFTRLEKFCNSCHNFSYHTFACVGGFVVLWDKPWLWDNRECWRDGSDQTVTNEVWWYFVTCLSFQWAQIFSILFGAKGKDFYVMMIHHFVLLASLILFWKISLFKIVTVALLVYDLSNVFLEGAQVAKYFGFRKLASFLYMVFTLTWMLVSLRFFLFGLLQSFYVETTKFWNAFPSYTVFYVAMDLVLFILNCVWFYFMAKMAISLCFDSEDDTRSKTANTTKIQYKTTVI